MINILIYTLQVTHLIDTYENHFNILFKIKLTTKMTKTDYNLTYLNSENSLCYVQL